MTMMLHAVFENGVLRPLSPLSLSEGQEVQVFLAAAAVNDDTNLQQSLSDEEYEAALDSLAEGLDLPILPPSAYTREGIYEGG